MNNNASEVICSIPVSLFTSAPFAAITGYDVHGLHAERVGGAERGRDVAEVGEAFHHKANGVAPVANGSPNPVPPRLEDVRLQHLDDLPAGQLRGPGRRGPERVQVREPPPPSPGPCRPGHGVAVGAALQLHEAVDPDAGAGRGRARVQELLHGVDAVLVVRCGGGGGGRGGERGGAGARSDKAEEGRRW